jgi:hypothetical protein
VDSHPLESYHSSRSHPSGRPILRRDHYANPIRCHHAARNLSSPNGKPNLTKANIEAIRCALEAARQWSSSLRTTAVLACGYGRRQSRGPHRTQRRNRTANQGRGLNPDDRPFLRYVITRVCVRVCNGAAKSDCLRKAIFVPEACSFLRSLPCPWGRSEICS